MGLWKRRQGSEVLKEEKRTKAFFFFKPRADDCTTKQLILLKDIFFLKLCESEVAQLCLTLCYPMDCSLPGSSVHGIFQAIVLQWIAISCPILLGRHELQPTRLLCPSDFPGKNTEVGCHFFLQGIFPTQESNSCLLHWQADTLPLSHQGSQVSAVLSGLFLMIQAGFWSSNHHV